MPARAISAQGGQEVRAEAAIGRRARAGIDGPIASKPADPPAASHEEFLVLASSAMRTAFLIDCLLPAKDRVADFRAPAALALNRHRWVSGPAGSGLADDSSLPVHSRSRC